MKPQLSPRDIYNEYNTGVSYNQYIGLYPRVTENENFFIGRQWEGVNAPDLDKPVINILGRVVSYFVAMLSSDDIAASVSPMGRAFTGDTAKQTKIISQQLRALIEQNDLTNRSKDLLRNAAVDGDTYLHLYFDGDAPTDQAAKGIVKAEIVENTSIFFGNPLSDDKEAQPYILLASRVSLDSVRAEMKEWGVSNHADSLLADGSLLGTDPFEPKDTVTLLCRYWKQDGRVWVCKCTKTTMVMPPTDTGYSRYPISGMCWERVKGSYHGQAAVTGLIPNQIAINKLFAMAIKYQKELAFPKILYDRTKIDRWSNRIGAIGVNGDPSSAVVRYAGGADMSGQVLQLVDRLISYTRDMMGASDAALGNIKANNTSAIIALQQSTAVPLDLKRRAFFRMMEETARIFLDIASVDYGVRRVTLTDDDSVQEELPFDFSLLSDLLLELHVDIGQSPYFSELAQLATLDNLFTKGIVTDAIDYLEAVPDNRLRNKRALIEQLKRRRSKAAAIEKEEI